MNTITVNDRVRHVKEGIRGTVVDVRPDQNRFIGVRWDGYRGTEWHHDSVLVPLHADIVNSNTSLSTLRHMAKNAFTTSDPTIDIELLAEEFQRLDEHLSKGGWPPAAWDTSFRGRIHWLLFGNRSKARS